MKRLSLTALLLIFLPGLHYAATPATVVVPAADVWNNPDLKSVDDNRETQVLFGERVLVLERRGDWARIEAVEQPEFTHHQKWEGYPGWVDAQFLKIGPVKEAGGVVISSWTACKEPESMPSIWFPFGSFVRPIGKTREWLVVSAPQADCGLDPGAITPLPTKDTRDRILASAGKMLGVSYLWGGLTAGKSPPQPLMDTPMKYGVDCSGLVHLSYRANGITVPRDSHEQWMKAKPLTRDELRPADLIFSAKAANPKKITHVALYAGDEQILEAPQTGLAVRKIPFKEKYGRDFITVESGDAVSDNRVVYFGRLLKD